MKKFWIRMINVCVIVAALIGYSKVTLAHEQTDAAAKAEADRKNAADIIGESFVEVYVSTSLEECEKRDVKGLYKKARAGEIPNFTGISSEYEVPVSPDITVDTENLSVAEAADAVMAQLEKHL